MPMEASTRFMVASGGVLSRNGHGRLGFCLGDDQTGAEGVPSQCGRGDALLRRMPPYLTCFGEPELRYRSHPPIPDVG